MNENLWMRCPLYLAYRKSKRDCLAAYGREKKRLKQEERLRTLLESVFDGTYEPKKEYWMSRMYENFRRRFYRSPGADWISFLGGMTDGQACGKYVDRKTRKYCILVRDAAKKVLENGVID